LATTEVEKVPDTVVSRCQTFIFKKPTQLILKEAVMDIAKKEGYSLDAQSAELIALLGDGAFRDSLVTLQKVLNSVSGKKITSEDVARVTSAPSSVLVNKILTSLAEGNIGGGLGAINKAVENSVDFKLFMKLILKKIRIVLLLRFAPELKKTFVDELSEDDMKLLEGFAKQSKSINSTVLSELLEAYTATDRVYLPQLPLELAFIKIMGKEEK